jgi:2-hydroxychromene-2-carboxylate isomerase
VPWSLEPSVNDMYVDPVTKERVDPLASTAPLIVYLDYKSPYAYLAKDPTYRLAADLGVEIDWRPLTLDIPSYLGSARLGEKGEVVENGRTPEQWRRVKHAYHDARRYASLRGLVVRGTTKIWDSSLAGIGMLWAKAQSRSVLRAYTDRVYERFWKRELDIEDVTVIEGVLGEAGARTGGFRDFAEGEGASLNRDMQRAIFDAGIFGVPTYVVGGEVFFGREHLPRIRWLLGGRRGPSPDVAYRNFSAEPIVIGGAKAPLCVAIDFKSPQAYLAIAPTCALADEIGIDIDWRPFVVPSAKKPRPPSAHDDRGARHRRMRAEYVERDLRRYAEPRGLELGDLARSTDSTLPAIGLLWAKQSSATVARSYVERMFDRHWRDGLDIADPRTVRTALEEAGAPVSGFEAFASGEGRTQLDRQQTELEEAGVIDAPAYRLEDDVFHGREHLPMIRWLLSGRAGEPPI